jgi:putative DNA primase/helicase
MIGEVAEHILAINFGNGGNGKGTYTEALLHVFGEYGVAVPSELLMERRGERHPTERADLLGARLASAEESEEGCKLNVALVKALTGGNTLKARRMREDFWSFEPTHQLWLSTNHKPEITETKDAIWRRVLLIGWPVQPATVDPHLKDKLRAEAPGILAWAVEGARLYQQDGIAAPASVVAAGAAYRAQQDVLGAFLRERCVLHEAARVTKSALHGAYRRWLSSQGEDDDAILSAKVFAEKVREHGCEDVSSMRTGPNTAPERGWRGIRLKSSHELALDAQAAEQTAETADTLN